MLISIATSIFIIMGIVYNSYSMPVYNSSATIIISKDNTSSSFLDYGINNNLNHIENEIEILKSRSTSEEVIRKLLMSEDYYPLHIFNSIAKENVGEILSSDSNVSKFARKLSSSISILHKRNTDALNISIESYNPDEAALIVNTIIFVYSKSDLEWAAGEMIHMKDFLLSQIKKKETELTNIEERLKEFQETEKIYTIDASSNVMIDNVKDFEMEFSKTLVAIKIIKEKINYIEGQLTDYEKDLGSYLTNKSNDKIASLSIDLTKAESELILTRNQYGEGHSAVSSLTQKVFNLKKLINIETKKMIEGKNFASNPLLYRQSLIDSLISYNSLESNLKAKSLAYKSQVEKYNHELNSLPEKVLSYTRLDRVRAVHAETYTFMQKKLEEARIGEASKIGKVRIIDEAISNNYPIKPKKLKNILFSIISSLLVSLSLIFLIEILDRTVKSVEQVERRGLNILALVPSIKKSKKDKRYTYKNNIENLQRRLITFEDPKSPIAESYRGLRTSLVYSGQASKTDIILVSSPGPGEGKTTTIANLAITYAALNKKVVLIDSDLRKPVLHKVFNIEKNIGLTNYLTKNANINEVIKETEVKNLDVVTCGIVPPNPSELLDSERMSSFIDELKNKYDVILFDTPPLIAVTDAYVLMKYISQFVLVIRAGVTQKGAFERCLVGMDNFRSKVTGVVMNAMSEEYSYGSGYYYNYYQNYYASNDDNKDS